MEVMTKEYLIQSITSHPYISDSVLPIVNDLKFSEFTVSEHPTNEILRLWEFRYGIVCERKGIIPEGMKEGLEYLRIIDSPTIFYGLLETKKFGPYVIAFSEDKERLIFLFPAQK